MKTERIIANFNAIIERECQKDTDFKRLTDLQAVLIGELKQRVHELEVENTKLKNKGKRGTNKL